MADTSKTCPVHCDDNDVGNNDDNDNDNDDDDDDDDATHAMRFSLCSRYLDIALGYRARKQRNVWSNRSAEINPFPLMDR